MGRCVYTGIFEPGHAEDAQRRYPVDRLGDPRRLDHVEAAQAVRVVARVALDEDVTRWDDLWPWFACSTAGVALISLGTEMLRWGGVGV